MPQNSRSPEQEDFLNEMEHVLDSPIDWDQVDKIGKPSLFKCVKHYLFNYVDPDIYVKIGDNTFHCHVLVLKCYAAYFKRFKYGETVILPEEYVSADAFETVYDWMLSPKERLLHILTRRNSLDLLLAAQYLGISVLEEQCWAFIDSISIFNEETALILHIKAALRNIYTVADLMLPRISRAFLPLVKSDVFEKLPKHIICSLLSSNFIAVHGEDEVLMAAVKWVLYDWKTRQKDLVDIMKCVRFGFLSPCKLTQLQNDQSEYFAQPEVRDMIEEGLAYAVCRCSYQELQGEWVTQLKLKIPEHRNWIGPEINKQYASLAVVSGSSFSLFSPICPDPTCSHSTLAQLEMPRPGCSRIQQLSITDPLTDPVCQLAIGDHEDNDENKKAAGDRGGLFPLSLNW